MKGGEQELTEGGRALWGEASCSQHLLCYLYTSGSQQGGAPATLPFRRRLVSQHFRKLSFSPERWSESPDSELQSRRCLGRGPSPRVAVPRLCFIPQLHVHGASPEPCTSHR